MGSQPWARQGWPRTHGTPLPSCNTTAALLHLLLSPADLVMLLLPTPMRCCAHYCVRGHHLLPTNVALHGGMHIGDTRACRACAQRCAGLGVHAPMSDADAARADRHERQQPPLPDRSVNCWRRRWCGRPHPPPGSTLTFIKITGPHALLAHNPSLATAAEQLSRPALRWRARRKLGCSGCKRSTRAYCA